MIPALSFVLYACGTGAVTMGLVLLWAVMRKAVALVRIIVMLLLVSIWVAIGAWIIGG